jgi:hypothetical protein
MMMMTPPLPPPRPLSSQRVVIQGCDRMVLDASNSMVEIVVAAPPLSIYTQSFVAKNVHFKVRPLEGS